VIHVRRDEAELLRLVGAQPSFVRRPYAYAGALSAACGAALAIGIAVVAYDAIAPHWAAAAQALELPVAAVTLPVGLASGFVLMVGVLGGLVGGLAARAQIRNRGVE
jgi:cell division transport system permease protein